MRLRRVPAASKSGALHLSIIVPCRNEEARLPILLQSIRESSIKPFEVIVVDDGSDDQTSEVGRTGGARIVQARDKPSGWNGKTWACFEGAQAARGDVFLFLDADTFLETKGLERIIGHITLVPGALSIQPYHQIKRPYESLSAFFNMVQVIASGAFTILGPKQMGIRMFGPCLAIRKEDYFRSGGHETVKNEILENFHLSKKLAALGIPITCLIGKGTIRFRMYPAGVRELFQGWSRAFSRGAAHSSIPILIMTMGWFTGALGTTRHLVTSMINGNEALIPHLLFFYLLYVVQVWWVLMRLGNFGFLTALLFPFGMTFFVVVFVFSLLRSLAGGTVVWKGQKIRP